MEPFQSPRRDKLYKEIYEQIFTKDKKLNPGDKLPSERQLAEQMQVGRPAIREALRTLENMGFIESKVGDGTYVKELTLHNIIFPVSVLMNQNHDLLKDILEVRLMLETQTARLAACRITSEQIGGLGRVIRQMEKQLEHGDCVFTEDINFHLQIARATQNSSLEVLLQMCRELINIVVKAVLSRPNEPYITLKEHQKIFEAVAAHDPDGAEKAMEEHLHRTSERIFQITQEM